MKQLFYLLFIVLLLINSCKSKEVEYQIGIISVIQHEALDSTRIGFINSFKANGFIENKDVSFTYNCANGNISDANQIISTFIGERKDLILAIGTSVAIIAKEKSKGIPIIFAAVTDPIGEKLVESLEYPSGNVTGTSDLNPVKEQLLLIRKLLPKAKNIGIMFNNSESNSRFLVKMAENYTKEMGLKLVYGTANKTADVKAAIASIIKKVDAVYMPTDNTMASAISVIGNTCLENNIPFFSSETQSVKDGLTLASLCVNYYQLGLQTGEIAQQVLKGKSPSRIPVEFVKKSELVINKKLADKYKTFLTEDLLQNAILVE